jgi:hypothetical protein
MAGEWPMSNTTFFRRADEPSGSHSSCGRSFLHNTDYLRERATFQSRACWKLPAAAIGFLWKMTADPKGSAPTGVDDTNIQPLMSARKAITTSISAAPT